MSFNAFSPQHLVCTGQLLAPDAAALARLLLLAPVLEEWVVRAGLQEWLLRRAPAQAGSRAASCADSCADSCAGSCTGSRAGAALLSTAAFGLLHLGAGWRAVLLVLAPGLALALLYQRSRDWRLCALLHCGFNALAIGACAP